VEHTAGNGASQDFGSNLNNLDIFDADNIVELDVMCNLNDRPCQLRTDRGRMKQTL
jgi:hypothetical protein